MRTMANIIQSKTGSDVEQERVGAEGATYIGKTTPLGRVVLVLEGDLGKPLQLQETPGGRAYSWGRRGSRVRELSRAILIDATGNEMLAERLCRPFTWELVSGLPADSFTLRRDEVLAWVEDYRSETVPSAPPDKRLAGYRGWRPPRVSVGGLS